ncbi:MAG: dethiobiotin synthase [Pseudonocardia sp.]|nr:dethiobiotin synthase [Pseudonocardia sp.]
MTGRILLVSGTGTDVGKTVVTAAVAALAVAAGDRVAVLKPAQTGLAEGEPGDLAQVRALVPAVTTRELARYPAPLAPDTAARLAGLPPVTTGEIAQAATRLAGDHDLVLVEGAGALLVRFAGSGTLADVAAELGAAVLVVAAAGLGTLNHTALTTEALAVRELCCTGVVVGSWPRDPDLASRCNLEDLPAVTRVPLLGALPEGSGALAPDRFIPVARRALAPELGGVWPGPRG